jgi:hypothetical protein
VHFFRMLSPYPATITVPLQGALVGTRPTVPVSEGVAARIALGQQDDPDVFIFGPAKSIIPAVLLTF